MRARDAKQFAQGLQYRRFTGGVRADDCQEIAAHFDEWLEMLIDAVERLKTRGVLRSDADSRALASGLLSALQGGYLLAKASRDVYPMRAALDMAIAQLGAYATETDSSA